MKDKNKIWSILEWTTAIVWFVYWIAFAVLSIVFRDDLEFSQKYGLIIPAIGIGITVGSLVARIINKVQNRAFKSSKPAAEAETIEEKNKE